MREKLFNLMKENPELPIKILTDTMCEGYGYSLSNIIKRVEKTKIYFYLDKVYTEEDLDDLKDEVYEHLTITIIEGENDKIVERAIQETIDELEQYECILIWCSN